MTLLEEFAEAVSVVAAEPAPLAAKCGEVAAVSPPVLPFGSEPAPPLDNVVPFRRRI